MKYERLPIAAKEHLDRFQELGSKLLAVPKDEIDVRDKKWNAAKKQKRRRKSA